MSGVNRVPEQSVFKGFLSIFKGADRASASSKLMFIASGFFLATASFFYFRHWGKQASKPTLQDKKVTPVVSKDEEFDANPEEIERSVTPDEALGKQNYHGRVSPLSPTHSTHSNENFFQFQPDTNPPPRQGTPDSAYGKQIHKGHVTSTSEEFPNS